MPIEPINFEELRPTATGVPDYTAALMKGMQAGFYPRSEMADIAYKEAQAKKELAQANLPFGGANVPGPAGQIVGLEMVRRLYGDNSPQYQMAQKAFQLSQSNMGARIGYENALTQSMPIRYTTPEGRQIIEQSNVAQGFSPSGTPIGEPIAPGQAPYNPNAISGQQGNNPILQNYNLRQLKQNVPQSVMQKNLYATNIEKTLDTVDLDTLTQYNGPKGQVELRKQQALDAVGKSDDKYKKYKENLALLNFLASQTRQFYGDSIQPSAMEEKLKLLDPTGMFKSSETGKSVFRSNAGLLKKELKTYRDATKNIGVYTGEQGENAPTKSSSSSYNALKILDYKYNSPQEFQEAFNTLSPQNRAIVKKAMLERGLH